MFKQYCKEKVGLIENELVKLVITEEALSPVLSEAMRYSLMAGGKRLRPILLMAAADAVGGAGTKYLQAACAMEMIHTYSLIHDDLPAMDNDDYRRGKLTNHKVYGEAMAILAGDALLTQAFVVLSRQPGVPPAKLLQVVQEISAAAGQAGMVGGQVIDLLSENKQIDRSTLEKMHQGKTGALFKAAIRSGAILADASKEQLAALTTYAEKFGLAFQITDDILDVTGSAEKIGKPVGSDIRNNKSTYVTLSSLATAQKLAAQTVEEALAALTGFGDKAEVLRQIVNYLVARDK